MLSKYQQNLRVAGNNVYSYNTHVATIDGSKLIVHGHWSKTTSKHVNYVAKEYGLTKVDGPANDAATKSEDDSMSLLRSVGIIASLGKLIGGAETKSEDNKWKLRMIKAGVPAGALHLPEDWDELSEDEKETRLNKVIEVFTEKKTG